MRCRSELRSGAGWVGSTALKSHVACLPAGVLGKLAVGDHRGRCTRRARNSWTTVTGQPSFSTRVAITRRRANVGAATRSPRRASRVGGASDGRCSWTNGHHSPVPLRQLPRLGATPAPEKSRGVWVLHQVELSGGWPLK